MHRTVVAAVLLATCTLAQTPQPSPDELLLAKLASPFLQVAPWRTDWDAALAAAKAQQRLVFAYFTTVHA